MYRVAGCIDDRVSCVDVRGTLMLAMFPNSPILQLKRELLVRTQFRVTDLAVRQGMELHIEKHCVKS